MMARCCSHSHFFDYNPTFTHVHQMLLVSQLSTDRWLQNLFFPIMYHWLPLISLLLLYNSPCRREQDVQVPKHLHRCPHAPPLHVSSHKTQSVGLVREEFLLRGPRRC